MNDFDERFIQAYKTLHEMGVFSIISFSAAAGSCKSVVSEFLNGKRNRHASVAWFSALCKFGASGDWLLTGRGSMLQGVAKKRIESEKTCNFATLEN